MPKVEKYISVRASDVQRAERLLNSARSTAGDIRDCLRTLIGWAGPSLGQLTTRHFVIYPNGSVVEVETTYYFGSVTR